MIAFRLDFCSLGARDGQVGLLGAGHDDPGRGRSSGSAVTPVGEREAEDRGLDRLAGELRAHGGAHLGVGLQRGPRRRQALVARRPRRPPRRSGSPRRPRGSCPRPSPASARASSTATPGGILGTGKATLEDRARDPRRVRLGHEAHDDEVRPARDAGGGRDQRADRGGLLHPVDGLELGLRRPGAAGSGPASPRRRRRRRRPGRCWSGSPRCRRRTARRRAPRGSGRGRR